MRYPGTLPGHDPKKAYTVSLAPLAKGTVATFMRIEQPDWAKPANAADWVTIEDLYDQVRKELEQRNPAFGGRKQLPLDENPGPGRLVQVSSLGTAIEAIETNVDQGEGHKPHEQGEVDAEDDDDHDVAHFDQFAAIAKNLDTGLIAPARDVYPVVAKSHAELRKTKQAYDPAYVFRFPQDLLKPPDDYAWLREQPLKGALNPAGVSPDSGRLRARAMHARLDLKEGVRDATFHLFACLGPGGAVRRNRRSRRRRRGRPRVAVRPDERSER